MNVCTHVFHVGECGAYFVSSVSTLRRELYWHRQMIRADMLEWKASPHMWPLSCYGFHGRCLPDLKDILPEELRWEAYVGMHMGKVQVYIQAERALVDTQRSIQSRYEDISVGDAAVFVRKRV